MIKSKKDKRNNYKFWHYMDETIILLPVFIKNRIISINYGDCKINGFIPLSQSLRWTGRGG